MAERPRPRQMGGLHDDRVSTRVGRDGWQRVEDREAPIRESWRGGPPAARRSLRDDPSPPPRRAGEKSRLASREEPPAKRRATERASAGVTKIKVTNIPKDVTDQDLRDAFEQETGKITRCRLQRGTAEISFSTAKAAKKAVDTFDRGELNGKTIRVMLDE